jgi:hypothetical protein
MAVNKKLLLEQGIDANKYLIVLTVGVSGRAASGSGAIPRRRRRLLVFNPCRVG